MKFNTLPSCWLCLAALALLSGCASTRPPLVTPVNTAFELQVLQPFDALPNGSYVDFQQGQRILPGNLDRWTTYCRLYVYNRDRGADYRTAVLPGDFAISAVNMAYRSSDYPNQPRFGELSWGVRDYPAYYLYQVGMRLDSPDQPEVQSLVCYKKWATPRANEYPTLAEIRAALGNLARLDLPAGASLKYQPRG